MEIFECDFYNNKKYGLNIYGLDNRCYIYNNKILDNDG